MKFKIHNWLSGAVQFTAEIDCDDSCSREIKLGLAVKWAVKTGASLVGARLDGASLDGASLGGARLDGASLVGASLVGARLDGASLVGARLDGARLGGARLDGARLVGARLVGARLVGASLDGASLPAFQIPQEGELIVWKKIVGGIAKMRVPPEARRTISLVGRKCRAEWVEVLEVYAGKKKAKTGTGVHDHTTIYAVGEVTKPDKYDDDIRVECTNGIHFFLTREEAESY